MSRHSPGPWRYCGSGRGGCSCAQVWSVTADHPVATAYRGGDADFGKLERDVLDANARLIAAAPELLELVRKHLGNGNLHLHQEAEKLILRIERIDGK